MSRDKKIDWDLVSSCMPPTGLDRRWVLNAIREYDRLRREAEKPCDQCADGFQQAKAGTCDEGHLAKAVTLQRQTPIEVWRHHTNYLLKELRRHGVFTDPCTNVACCHVVCEAARDIAADIDLPRETEAAPSGDGMGNSDPGSEAAGPGRTPDGAPSPVTFEEARFAVAGFEARAHPAEIMAMQELHRFIDERELRRFIDEREAEEARLKRALVKERERSADLRRALLARLSCASVNTSGSRCTVGGRTRHPESFQHWYDGADVWWTTKDQDHDATKAREDEMIKQAVEAAEGKK